jgi:integrase
MPLKIVRRADTGALTIVGTVSLSTGERLRVRQRAQSDRRSLAAEEAVAIEAQLLREAFHGERRGSRPFAAAVTSYIKAQPRSQRTLALLERILLAVGNVSLAAIDQEAIDRARDRLFKAQVTPATVLRDLITPVRAIMAHAARRRWCDVPEFEIPRQSAGRTRFLLPAEAERLLAAAAPHLRPLLLFLLGTGARMSEAIELEWRDVDLEGKRAILWRTKGGIRRDVQLPPRVAGELSERRREGAVFLTQRGRPYADKAREGGGHIKTAWRATLRRAGLDPALTPHDLRHTWASWRYATHKDLLLLKQEGRWSSVTLVERYAHLLPAGHEGEIKAFWKGDRDVEDRNIGREDLPIPRGAA